MATTLLTDTPLQKKYTVSFLNQLQTEWNDFLLEVSHSTPIVNVNINAGSVNFSNEDIQKKIVEPLNESIHSFGENIIPVPLNVLKRLLSPTKFNGDDALKIDFLKKIKERLNLTNVPFKKLQKFLFSNLESSNEISDFPSPTVPDHFHNSAPARLYPKKPKNPRFLEPHANISRIINRIQDDNRNLFQKTTGETNKAKATGACNIAPVINEDTKNSKFVNTKINNVVIKEPTEKNIILKEGRGNSRPNKHKSNKFVRRNNRKTPQYSNIYYDLDAGGSSNSSTLFYNLSHSQNKKISKPTIVFTYFSQIELAEMYQIVNKLGNFEIENTVSLRTSHLICGTSKKTMNLCQAVVRGCWILDKDWIMMSAKENRWLFEERFEKTNLWPAVKENRVKRRKCGKLYQSDIFENCNMYVSELCTQPTANDLKELIILAGGNLENSLRRASHVIGPVPKLEYIKEIWILNCILQGTAIDTCKYMKHA